MKSFELTNRNEKKDLEQILSLVKKICSGMKCSTNTLQVEESTSMSADQLANRLGIPVIVARERSVDFSLGMFVTNVL